MIKVFLADNQFLTREGLRSLFTQNNNIETVGEAGELEEMKDKILEYRPEVVLVDYANEVFNHESLQFIRKELPNAYILSITPQQSKSLLITGLDLGVTSYLLKSCGREEIIDAVHATANGENFFCGKIIEKVLDETPDNIKKDIVDKLYSSCEPVKLSEREIEILNLITRGYTNKEISNKLCLSNHTIVTHRKNIMRRLGIHNTAGLVVYAVRENLINPVAS